MSKHVTCQRLDSLECKFILWHKVLRHGFFMPDHMTNVTKMDVKAGKELFYSIYSVKKHLFLYFVCVIHPFYSFL